MIDLGPGTKTTVVGYELLGRRKRNTPMLLEIRPLIAFRDYHSTTHGNNALNPQAETEDGVTTVQPYADLPALHFAHDNCEVDTAGYWYRNFEYAVERGRGLDSVEDLFNPFSLTFDLKGSKAVRIIASTERQKISSANVISMLKRNGAGRWPPQYRQRLPRHQRLTQWLANFQTHLDEAGLGQVSEIFDGDPPHTARGCIAQAWSVAELLRAAYENVYSLEPSRGALKAQRAAP